MKENISVKKVSDKPSGLEGIIRDIMQVKEDGYEKYSIHSDKALNPSGPVAVAHVYDSHERPGKKSVEAVDNGLKEQLGKKAGYTAIRQGIRKIAELDPNVTHITRLKLPLKTRTKIQKIVGELDALSINRHLFGNVDGETEKAIAKKQSEIFEISRNENPIHVDKKIKKSLNFHLKNLKKAWFFNREVRWAGSSRLDSKPPKVEETTNKKATYMRDGKVANITSKEVKTDRIPEEKRKSVQKRVEILSEMPKNAKDSVTRKYTQLRDGRVAMITFAVK